MAASLSIIWVLPAWILTAYFGTLNADITYPVVKLYRPKIIGMVLAYFIPSIALSWRMF